MQILGWSRIPLAEIVADSTFSERQELKSVTEMVHYLRTGIRFDPPRVVVRHHDTALCCGDDYVAALLVCGDHKTKALTLEASDHELELLRAYEKARLFGGPEERKSAVLALVDALYYPSLDDRNALAASLGGPAVVGKKSCRTMAREVVSTITGLTPESIRKLETRELGAPKPERAEWKLNTYGNIASAALLHETAEIRRVLDSVDRSLRQVTGALSKLSDTRLGTDRFVRISEAVAQAGRTVRACLPDSLCPWCKDVPKIRSQCLACWSSGYVTIDKAREAGPELMNHRCAVYNGEYVDTNPRPDGKMVSFQFPELQGVARIEPDDGEFDYLLSSE